MEQRSGEVISAVTLLALHRDKIGAGSCDIVLDTLIDLLAKALTTPEESEET